MQQLDDNHKLLSIKQESHGNHMKITNYEVPKINQITQSQNT